jgi:RNA polymerase sigma-32 factor
MGSLSSGFSTTPEDNLSRYLQEIRHFPLLEYQEELSLSRKWRDSSCKNASHRLVTSHLRLVVKIAVGYRGYGLPVGELISEGNVGMMQAVNRFDPEKGFRLSTYAMWWIRAAIQEYVLRSWSLVKMGTTAAQKKLFFNLRKLKGQIKAIEDGDMTPEHTTEIADRLNVSETEVVNMNRRMAGSDHSLNAPLSIDGDGEWLDWLKDDNDSQESVYAENEVLGQRQALLSNALEGLSSRETHILEERRLKDNPTTLESLSQKYGISRERIRQIEVRAFEKIQKSVRNAVINQHYSC